VNSVGRLIERINRVNEDVGRLVEGLVRRSKMEQARVVTEAMTDIVKICTDSIDEVFERDAEEPGAVTDDREVVNHTGAMAVMVDAIQQSQRPRDPPIVKKFERLSLLG